MPARREAAAVAVAACPRALGRGLSGRWWGGAAAGARLARPSGRRMRRQTGAARGIGGQGPRGAGRSGCQVPVSAPRLESGLSLRRLRSEARLGIREALVAFAVSHSGPPSSGTAAGVALARCRQQDAASTPALPPNQGEAAVSPACPLSPDVDAGNAAAAAGRLRLRGDKAALSPSPGGTAMDCAPQGPQPRPTVSPRWPAPPAAAGSAGRRGWCRRDWAVPAACRRCRWPRPAPCRSP